MTTSRTCPCPTAPCATNDWPNQPAGRPRRWDPSRHRCAEATVVGLEGFHAASDRGSVDGKTASQPARHHRVIETLPSPE